MSSLGPVDNSTILAKMVSVQGVCFSLGERMDLSAGCTKTILRKRSIHQYVRLPKCYFRARYAKYSLLVHEAGTLTPK